MAGWDTAGLLTALVTRLSGVTGLAAQVGVPNSISGLFTVYVTAADQDYRQKTTETITRDVAAFAWFAYRTEGNVSAAELAIAAAIDEFAREFFADRTLGGILEDGQLDMRLAGTEAYLTVGGREFRQYPVRVVGKQTEVVSAG